MPGLLGRTTNSTALSSTLCSLRSHRPARTDKRTGKAASTAAEMGADNSYRDSHNVGSSTESNGSRSDCCKTLRTRELPGTSTGKPEASVCSPEHASASKQGRRKQRTDTEHRHFSRCPPRRNHSKGHPYGFAGCIFGGGRSSEAEGPAASTAPSFRRSSQPPPRAR